MLNLAYIAVGSNIDPFLHIPKGLEFLARLGTITKTSRWYRTPPWGETQQPPFINLCLALETTLTAEVLLATLLAIETTCGRQRDIPWGPRTLDLDLLAYNYDEIDIPNLQVPHPRIAERAFVLVPLADITDDGAPFGLELSPMHHASILPETEECIAIATAQGVPIPERKKV